MEFVIGYGEEPQPLRDIKGNWGITLMIPSFKKVNHLGKYQAYNLFDEKEQKIIMQTMFNDACKNVVLPPTCSELYFEKHTDGRIHSHLYILDAYEQNVYMLQYEFCKLLGVRPKQYEQLFNVIQPDNIDHWITYCKKLQTSSFDNYVFKGK